MKDRTGRENPGAFREGEDSRRSLGGAAKGMRVSTALLRILDLPEGAIKYSRRRGFYVPEETLAALDIPANVAQKLAARLAGIGGKIGTDDETAIRAILAVTKITEGDTLNANLSGKVSTDYAGYTTEQLVALRAALMAPPAADKVRSRKGGKRK